MGAEVLGYGSHMLALTWLLWNLSVRRHVGSSGLVRPVLWEALLSSLDNYKGPKQAPMGGLSMHAWRSLPSFPQLLWGEGRGCCRPVASY